MTVCFPFMISEFLLGDAHDFIIFVCNIIRALSYIF